MSEKPKFMTHELIMAGEEYVSYSDYLLLQRERDKAREDLDEEKKFHHRTHAELIQTQCKLLDMQMGRDEAREEINRYREKLDLLPISWDV